MREKHTIGTRVAEGARRAAAGELGPGEDAATARLDAELLLAHVLGVSRTWLLAHANDELDGDARAREYGRYVTLIERRARGEPLAYLLGRKDFWTLRFSVTAAVLVPRPETELLVERALALVEEPAARVVDLGTGSGAIALALASERPQWQVVATDTSAEALAVARINAVDLGLARTELLQGSWFTPLAGRRFHLIVSNPPYIAANDPALARAALQFEPQVALTAGADGMACLRTIVRDAPNYLERSGWLLLEHGPTQAADVARELVVRGFTHVRSHRDLAGHERVTEARWN